MNNIFRLVIIEPSPIIVAGLRSILDTMPQINVVAILSDTSRLSERLPQLQADLIILNPSLIDFQKRTSIKSLLANIILIGLLYSHIDKNTLSQFQFFIDIYDDPHKITQTILEALSEPISEDLFADTEDLSDREREILVAVAKGLMNKEIASLHHISIHTVISHRKNISRKTGIKSVSGFVVYALLNNLITQTDIQ